VQVFLSAIILCGILLFDSFFYVYQPYDGMEVYQEDPLGEVYVVYPGGPAELAGVENGDRILVVANEPVDPLRREPRYAPGLKPGDSVAYEFQRGGERDQPRDNHWKLFREPSRLRLYPWDSSTFDCFMDDRICVGTVRSSR